MALPSAVKRASVLSIEGVKRLSVASVSRVKRLSLASAAFDGVCPEYAVEDKLPIQEEDDEDQISNVESQACLSCFSTGSIKNLSEAKTPWVSIVVAGLCAFIQNFQFSIIFSSMWPYFQKLDDNATENFFGFIVAVYSFGQMITSPILGYWSNKTKKIAFPTQCGLFLQLIGSALYFFLDIIPFSHRWAMLIARFVTGLGSGNIALLRAYAAMAAVPKDQPRAIAFVTGGMALGISAGPALQLLFTPIGENGFTVFGFRITMYNSPALFSVATDLLIILLIHFFFVECDHGLVTSKANASTDKLPKFDKVAIAVCVLTRFTQMFINTNLETIGSPYSMMMYGWSKSQSVLLMSITQGIVGLISFAVYVAFIYFDLAKRIHFRLTLMVCLCVLVLFHLLTFSWPFIPGHVTLVTNANRTNGSTEDIGCNQDKFSWCKSLTPVNPWFFYACLSLCVGIAFPTVNITLTTIFSRAIGPRRQGTLQGIFQMFGGGARMSGPIAISSVYVAMGPRGGWIMEIAVIAATLVLWIVFYRRMVPLKVHTNEDPKEAIDKPSPIHKL